MSRTSAPDTASLLRRAVVTGIALVAASAASARADFIDQSNTANVTQFYNTNSSTNLPIGQEFTPTLGSLDFVDLHVDDAGSDIGPGADFFVNIRMGTIGGTIVGTSDTIHVPDGTNTGGGITITRLLFSTPVSLTPGSLYVLQVVQTGSIGGSNGNFGIAGNFGNTYTHGDAIIGGSGSPNFDFYFREGTVPEPGSLVLLSIGGLGFLALARRRRVLAS